MGRADDDGAGRARARRRSRPTARALRSVEPRGRLVGDDRARAGGDGPRDRGSLALTRRRARRPGARRAPRGRRGERVRARVSRVSGLDLAARAQSSTFSRAPRNGTSATVWPTNASRVRRSLGSPRAVERWRARRPSRRTSPASGRSSPASRCSSVVFPEPDGPVTAWSRAAREGSGEAVDRQPPSRSGG